MIDPYDEWVDGILCSEDFQNCTSKDVESNCLASKSRVRCWFLSKCPRGYKRG